MLLTDLLLSQNLLQRLPAALVSAGRGVASVNLG